MSVWKRGDKWVAKTTLNGKQEWIGTFKTKREARQAEAAHLAAAKPATGDETCDEFALRWTVEYPRPRSSTNRHNRQAVSRFAADFSGIPLSAVTRQQARRWVMANRSRLNAVRAMYGDALNDGLVENNPFSNLRIQQSRGRRDITALEPADVARLAETARRVHGAYGEQYAAMITVAAYTGIRRGEISVLEWDDVDFEANEITVSKTLSNDTEVLPPKNGKSRVIVLPPQARQALGRVPRRLDTPRIFSTTRGRRFSKSTFHYAWSPVRAAFGRPDLDWHELRHFTATFLVQELRLPLPQAALQLGHSDGGRLLMSLYAHPDEDRMRQEIHQAFAAGTPPIAARAGAASIRGA